MFIPRTGDFLYPGIFILDIKDFCDPGIFISGIGDFSDLGISIRQTRIFHIQLMLYISYYIGIVIIEFLNIFRS